MADEVGVNGQPCGVIGDELRKAREKAGLTQEDLAAKAGVSRNYVSLLEHDAKSPTVQVLIRLCKAMDAKASKMIAAVER